MSGKNLLLEKNMAETIYLQNHYLFSEAYLHEFLASPIAPAAPAAVQQTILEWREEYPKLEVRSQLLDYLAQALSTLGFTITRRLGPDHFTLFADETRSQPLGICLAVLDDDIGCMFKGRHYQVKLIKLLRESNLSWGVISNGSDWRLCYAKSPTPYEVYLQARLDDILHPQRLANFIHFFRFFGKDAFSIRETTSAGELRQGLDLVLAASETSTQLIERHLKNRVDDVLQALCLGFVNDEDSRNLEQPELDEIYRNAIYLLYRMLFLFYAEARHLLPVGDKAYKVHSLEAIIEDVRRWQLEGWRDENPHALWARLANLCGIVDIGDQQAGVNAYNGGLFSDSENPYLRKHQIKNDYLARAIFNLAYMETKNGLRRIEYRDLSVRHLGTLYEGMLEYRLNLVRDEPVVVRESKGKRLYVPQSVAHAKKGETILQIGEVYFADDKGERKSSGSYYTPEDVVQYIVSETLLPKLTEVSEPLKDIRAQAVYDRQIAVNPQEKARAESYADRQAEILVYEKLLQLKILDPAMGSAHFLVAAGQMLTNYIVEELNNLDWPTEISTDPLVWKRRIVERCLYGVDVNPLAQELAKLSLWLSSAAAGKPLTFLNHHLKVGNSLFGASIPQLSVFPISKKSETKAESEKQNADLFQHMYQQILHEMISEIGRIRILDSDHIEDVKEKGDAYQQAYSLSQRLQDIGNLWFGTLMELKDDNQKSLDETGYIDILQKAINTNSTEEWEETVSKSPILSNSRRLAKQKKFFHWELEFPDSIIGKRCQFDVILMNPPYVGTPSNKAINNLYHTASCNDLYAWILEKAIRILGEQNSYIGVVIPLSITFSKSMLPLREFLLSMNLHLKISSFDNRPEGLFNADKTSDGTNTENRQRTSVVIAKSGSKPIVQSTDFLQWRAEERKLLFTSLTFTDTTNLASKIAFPKIGDLKLANFWTVFIKNSSRTISTIAEDIFSESRRPEANSLFLTIPRAAYHNVSAVPGPLERNKVLSASFSTLQDLKLAQILLNSNIFFCYWRAFGDGFLLSTDLISAFPIPDNLTLDYLKFADMLDNAREECVTTSIVRGLLVPSYNFNKRMDILVEIDNFLIKHIAPNLGLSPNTFARYKSNSFLHPLEVTSFSEIIDLRDNE